MRTIGIVFIMLLLFQEVAAQNKYFTKNGRIAFFSRAPLENIQAANKNVTCVLDTKTGNIQFSVLMKGFEFEKALMQEHFNENYVESNKYPKADFKGQVVNNSEIDYSKDGLYPATVKGKLTIHGQTRNVESEGKFEVKNGKLSAKSEFNILVSDYKIAIPNLVKDKISNTVKIKVDLALEPLKG